MDSLNYYVRTYLESEGVMSQDDRVANPVFRPITTNSLEIGFAETSSVFQSLKVHIEVVQL